MTAKATARKIIKDWMAKEGATIECDLFVPITEAIAAAYEDAARWHDEQQQGWHCGEDTAEKIVRQRRNKWHAEAADAIRARSALETG